MTQAQTPKPRKGWLDKLTAVADMFAFPLRTSHYVELVNPLWTTHRMHARVVSANGLSIALNDLHPDTPARQEFS